MLESTIAANVRRVLSGKLDPVDWLEFYLKRIDRHDSKLRAWVDVDVDGALKTARDLAVAARAGRAPERLLTGAPIAIKDIIDVEGKPTKAGSPLREDHCAAADAPLVARLRAEGAIVLGKTVTTEFACFDPPPTINPWNVERTPGGSSSGSAAAVAANMCAAAIGSQTGGSITRPASFCGVAGLKPTFGAVSLTGVVPVSFHLDHPGPIAQNVPDLYDVYSAMRSRPPGLESGASRRFDEIYQAQWPPPVLGVIREFFHDAADEDVRSAFDAACTTLADAGATLEDVRLPASFERLHDCHRRIMAVDAAAAHRALFQEHEASFGPAVAGLIREGLDTSATDYSDALRRQRQFQRDLSELAADGWTALLCPATVTAAPGVETTGDPRFNSPWSYAGAPTISIPCGLTAQGLPCSLQFVSGHEQEQRLAFAAHWSERALDWQSCPPGWEI